MVIKSIRTLFLLFAGMAIVVHMMIPHDHHMTVLVTGLNESCPLSHEKSDHHPFFPSHCHAFNDLAVEKFTHIIVRLESQTSFISVIWQPDYIIRGLHYLQKVFQNSAKSFPDIYIPDFSPFRAPPPVC
jgi:hypothetical protein